MMFSDDDSEVREIEIEELDSAQQHLAATAPAWIAQAINSACERLRREREVYIQLVAESDLQWVTTFCGPPLNERWGHESGYRYMPHQYFEVSLTPEIQPAEAAKILREIASQLDGMESLPQPRGPAALTPRQPF